MAGRPLSAYEAPAPARSGAARSGAGRWVAGLAAAAVLVAIGVGGAALWTTRAGGDEVSGGTGVSTEVGLAPVTGDPDAPVPEGTVLLALPQAELGPLDVNASYPLSVSGGPDGATYQLLVDDAPVGDPASSLSAFIPETPGRHSVAVQAVSQAGTVTSEPIQIYVIGPVPAAGFRANLQSVRSTPENWPKVLASFDELKQAGHTGLLLLPSDRFASLQAGYWNLFVAGFGDDREAAVQYCTDFKLIVPDQCYVGRFDPGGGGA